MGLAQLLEELQSQFPDIQFTKLREHKNSLVVFVGGQIEDSAQVKVREFLAKR